MKIGFSLSNNQGIEDVREILDLATRAEAVSYTHLTLPTNREV